MSSDERNAVRGVTQDELPDHINEVIEELAGRIGRATIDICKDCDVNITLNAISFAHLYLIAINIPKHLVEDFVEKTCDFMEKSINGLIEELRYCPICNNIADQPPKDICSRCDLS